MALSTSVTISRTLLGLGDIELNDHANFYIAEFGDIDIRWKRQTVEAPWFDGEVTVQRNRGQVEQRIVIEVLGASTALTRSNITALVNALSQDNFNLTVTIDGEATTWACEASDYSVSMNKERAHSKRAQVTVVLRRKPVPLSGAF